MKPFAMVLTLCLLGQTALATEPPSATDAAGEYSPFLAVTLSWLPAAAMVGTGIGLLYGLRGESDAIAYIGFGLLAAGLTVGPSIGHMYTGDWIEVAQFSAGRLLGTGVLAFGLFSVFANAIGRMDQGPSADRDNTDRDLAVVVILGALPIVGLTVWEAIDAGECARQKNAGHELTLAPLVFPPAPSANQPSAFGVGMGLSGAF